MGARQAFVVQQMAVYLLEGLILEFGGFNYQSYFQTHAYTVALSDVDSEKVTFGA